MLRASRSSSALVPLAAAGLVLGVLCGVARADVFTNIPYFSPGGQSSLLDLYVPDGGIPPGSPTVIFIHGGGWTGGDKANNAPFCAELSAAGYAVINTNYTLASPGNPSFPQAIHDLKAVVRWARTTGANQFGLGPDIVVSGSSAGGHLAMMIGVTAGVGEFEPLPPPSDGYSIQGLIGMWGPSDLVWDVETFGPDQALATFLGVPYNAQTARIYAAASPINSVTRCDPPSAFYHGSADPVVPVQHTQFMQAALTSLGIYNEVSIAQGAGHGFGGFGGQAALARTIAPQIPRLLAHGRSPDLDRDGFLTGDDFTLFVTAFENGSRLADFDGDGFITGDDFQAFVEAFERGC